MKTNNQILKNMERGVTLLFVLLSLALLAGFVPFRLKAVETRMAREFATVGADSIIIDKIYLKLWQGAAVKGVRFSKVVENDIALKFYADQVSIRCNLVHLALAALVNEVPPFFADSLFQLITTKPAEGLNEVIQLLAEQNLCKGVSAEKCSFILYQNGQNFFQVADATINLKKKGKAAFDGSLGIHLLDVPVLARIENFEGDLSINEQQLHIENGKGTVFDGKLHLDTKINLSTSHLAGGHLRVDGLEMEKFCNFLEFKEGQLKGSVDFDLKFEKSVLLLDSLKGSGNATVSKVWAHELPLQKSIMVSFVSPKLTDLRFNKIKADYHLSDLRLNFNQLDAKGDLLDFSSQGWAALNGQLGINMEGELNKKVADQMSELVKASLEETKNGGRKFKCRISGTFVHPAIEVDKSIYGRAAGNVLGNVKQGFRNLFK